MQTTSAHSAANAEIGEGVRNSVFHEYLLMAPRKPFNIGKKGEHYERRHFQEYHAQLAA